MSIIQGKTKATKIGGKHNPFAIEVRTAKNNLHNIELAYKRISENNKDLTFKDICKSCKLTDTQQKHLKIFLDNDFDYNKVIEVIEPTTKMFGNDYIYSRLRKFKRTEEEVKYAKLLVPISFDVNPLTVKKDHTYKYKVGTVVKLAYYKSIADLYVFYFGGFQFPLRRDEFEWTEIK